MWKDSIRNIVVIFQPIILRIVGFYVRHSAIIMNLQCSGNNKLPPTPIEKTIRKNGTQVSYSIMKLLVYIIFDLRAKKHS